MTIIEHLKAAKQNLEYTKEHFDRAMRQGSFKYISTGNLCPLIEQAQAIIDAYIQSNRPEPPIRVELTREEIQALRRAVNQATAPYRTYGIGEPVLWQKVLEKLPS